jgi:beta-lactamase superfamily II metal-dependent hydrolase
MRFYVEKYDKYEKFILLDFIYEEDFYAFCESISKIVDIVKQDLYWSSMILINNISLNNIKEGQILFIDDSVILNLREYINDIFNVKKSSTATVFISFKSNKQFESNFIVEQPKNDDYDVYTDNTYWHNTPCSLLRVPNQVTVFDVGQGSWNKISSDDTVTYFDMGASVYYSYDKLRTLLDLNFKKNIKTSVIISHWDIDHYNLLNVMTDDELKSICCIFIPNKSISLTSKKIAKKLLTVCSYVVTIEESKMRKRSRFISMDEVFSNKSFKLFTGESSSSKNKSGLLLVLFGKQENVVLSADHSNYQVFNDVYDSFDNLLKSKPTNIIVPHHGGNAGSFKNIVHVVNPNRAIVSTGKNNYGHPFNNTRMFYTSENFIWMVTEYENDIVFNI